MKRQLVPSLLLLFVLFVGSVKTYAETPLDFNNRLTSITDSIYARGIVWNAKLKELSETKNYKELAPYRIGTQKYIDKEIAELKTMKGVGKGAPEFIKSMIEYLVFERQMTNLFELFEKFNSATTDEEMQKTIEKVTEDAQKEDGALKKVNAAQEAYAEKNNFSIEEGTPAEKDTE